MNNTQIEKILKLLNENKLKEVKDELITILLKNTDKTKSNLYQSVKSYLKESEKINNSRPVLKTVQQKNQKQFILNGFSAFLFKTYKTELESLENTKDEAICIDIFKIINKLPEYEFITKNDLILLKNIKKYIAFYKNQENYKKSELITVYFNNKIFDVKIIKQVYDIIGDLNNLKITPEKGVLTPTQLENDEILSIILPLRCLEEKKNNTIKITQEFIKMIKGE